MSLHPNHSRDSKVRGYGFYDAERVFVGFRMTGTGSRTQFPGNKITNIDPVALAFETKYYPHANNTSGPYNVCTYANNYIESPKQAQAYEKNNKFGNVDLGQLNP